MDEKQDPQSPIARALQARERGDRVAERDILERAVAAASGADADELRAELALVLVDQREADASKLCLMQCSTAVRESHPAALLARARLTWREKGRSRESRAAFESALSAARAAGDVRRAVAASLFIAEDEHMEGQGAAALQRLRAALAETRTAGLRRMQCHVMVVLTDFLLMGHASADVLAQAREGLELARELGMHQCEATLFGIIASVHAQTGAPKDAVDAANSACRAAEKSGDPHVVALAQKGAGEAHLAAGDARQAVAEFERCMTDSRERREDRTLCSAMTGRGEALLALGEITAAGRDVTQALALAARLGDRESELRGRAVLARIAEAKGDLAAALAAEKERHRVETELRFKQSSEHLDRIRAELQSERQQAEEARAAERALTHALEQVRRLEQRLSLENQYLRDEIVSSGGFEDIVGRAQPMKRMLQEIEQVAPTEASVLILGETGAGKELVARAIHARSARRDRPIVTVNCATLPASLVESELFGHEKGAFTGAAQRTIGRFELANGGTIFLDEIGELPLDLQAKLLRVLQEGEFERLGEGVTRRTDVRVIAATNRDLQAGMRETRFRADLYYRLAVFTIDVPSLRERREDIPLLVAHFAMRYQTRVGKRIERIPEETMRRFTAYDWPGNVRELANMVHRAVILSPGDALVLDGGFELPQPAQAHAVNGTPAAPAPSQPAPSAPADDSLRSAERAHVLRVLEACAWNVKGKGNAADRLGIPPSTLRSRMAKLGISRESRV